MCMECVNEGLITPEQHQRMIAGEDPADVLSSEQIGTIYGARNPEAETLVISSDDLADAPQFIKDLFKGLVDKAEVQDPKDAAQNHMDSAVTLVLEFIKGKRETAIKASGEADPLKDPRVRNAFLELLAGEAMYKMTPSTIAYALILMADRYTDLLDQWSTMYVAAASDPEDVFTDLDQAKTPESKVAFASKSQEFLAETVKAPGMYL